MAITGRKISSFQQLNNITGEEFIMVANNGKSYKLPIKLLLGNKIESITQEINTNEGEDSPITINLSDGTSMIFHVYNGKKGPKGDQGDQGEDGDPGLSIQTITNDNTLVDVLNSLVTKDTLNMIPEDQLINMIASAELGKYLETSIDGLKEYYYTQEEFENLPKESIDENAKYFIYED